jgi:hypothetical protein
MPDATKREGMRKALKWMLTSAQQSAAPLGFAQLPESLVARELAAIAEIR